MLLTAHLSSPGSHSDYIYLFLSLCVSLIYLSVCLSICLSIVCAHSGGALCHGTHVEVRGQLVGAILSLHDVD